MSALFELLDGIYNPPKILEKVLPKVKVISNKDRLKKQIYARIKKELTIRSDRYRLNKSKVLYDKKKIQKVNNNFIVLPYIPNYHIVIDKLDYSRRNVNYNEILEYYNNLVIPEFLFKYIMYKVYKKIYSRKIRNYTKDFMKFYNYRYHDNLKRKIKAKENKIKKLNRNLRLSKLSKERYKTSKLRLLSLENMISKLGYYSINLDSLNSLMIELKNSDNDSIIQKFIGNCIYNSDNDQVEFDIEKEYDDINAYSEYLNNNREEEFI